MAPAEASLYGGVLRRNEIETMRRFDPATQRTVRTKRGMAHHTHLNHPAREYLIPQKAGDSEKEEVSEFWLPSLHPYPSQPTGFSCPGRDWFLIDDQQALEDAINEVRGTGYCHAQGLH